MQVAIRADASRQMGSGHIMRCATLAGWLQQRGAEVTFICRELDGNYCDWLEAQGYSVLRLRKPLATDVPDHRLAHAHWLGVTQAMDSIDVRQALAGRFCDWLIVDHYALDAEWERELCTFASRIMVIDDLADRRHEADLLLDQNLQSRPNRYQGLVPDPCPLLLGPDYALLRPEFALRRATTQTRTGEIKRLLVFMGGSDPLNLTALALRAIADAGLSQVRTDVVLGAASPHIDDVREIGAGIADCNIHIQTNAMATLMAEADLMIGAPGSSTWERCCLGVPSVLIGFAENQRELGRQIALRKGAIFLGETASVSEERLATMLRRLAVKPVLLRKISSRATQFADGHGGARIAAALTGKLNLCIVSDATSWLNSYIPALVEQWQAEGRTVRWVHKPIEIPEGDCAFFLSCGQLASRDVLGRNTHNLVVHESALPQGRGWSPLTWQILEGKSCIPISLFEAHEDVDSGPIYIQMEMKFRGNELVDDLREAQANATTTLCRQFIARYPEIVAERKPQRGTATYYNRRRPGDSKLDFDKSLREQFNLLRVADNDRYPAYFECYGRRFQIAIRAMDDE